MFEFNQIYRQLESSLTEAAQFTELLMTPPAVVDPIAPESPRQKASDVRFEHVTFAHAGGQPLFTGLDLAVPSGTKLGLVGRSGGGKTTLTRHRPDRQAITSQQDDTDDVTIRRRPVSPVGRPALTPTGLRGGGQRSGGFRCCAFRFGQDDQLVPGQLGAYLVGGQLGAARAGHGRTRDGTAQVVRIIRF
jgi:hypothetical protein